MGIAWNWGKGGTFTNKGLTIVGLYFSFLIALWPFVLHAEKLNYTKHCWGDWTIGTTTSQMAPQMVVLVACYVRLSTIHIDCRVGWTMCSLITEYTYFLLYLLLFSYIYYRGNICGCSHAFQGQPKSTWTKNCSVPIGILVSVCVSSAQHAYFHCRNE